MSAQALIATARGLVAGDKDLPAMDESNPTCNRRFAKVGIPKTEEARRAYSIQAPTAVGAGVFVGARHSATGLGASARVIPTDEDLMFARHVWTVLNSKAAGG